MAAAAAVAGLTDFLGNARIRAISNAWKHMIGNIVAVLLALITFGCATKQVAKRQSGRGVLRCRS
ncbi:DUF2231 domain-containing protein [Ensifer aridi]|uniref:DUF2231 domain-containing protein n=1 Tax=Ensifer aridi TaxID=1708715 RepID=UPI00040D7BAB